MLSIIALGVAKFSIDYPEGVKVVWCANHTALPNSDVDAVVIASCSPEGWQKTAEAPAKKGVPVILLTNGSITEKELAKHKVLAVLPLLAGETDLKEAVDYVSRGILYVHDDVRISNDEQERTVHDLLVQGFKPMEIARRTGLPAPTVRMHQSNLMQKFGSENLLDLVFATIAAEQSQQSQVQQLAAAVA
jgi:DNA-binding CsgD family transcriptional regulator